MSTGGLQLTFWLAALMVLYAYAGYPLLLRLILWLRPAPDVRKASQTPTVSLLIVAHNEEEILASKLRDWVSMVIKYA